jgi:hypothetical protein
MSTVPPKKIQPKKAKVFRATLTQGSGNSELLISFVGEDDKVYVASQRAHYSCNLAALQTRDHDEVEYTLYEGTINIKTLTRISPKAV